MSRHTQARMNGMFTFVAGVLADLPSGYGWTAWGGGELTARAHLTRLFLAEMRGLAARTGTVFNPSTFARASGLEAKEAKSIAAADRRATKEASDTIATIIGALNAVPDISDARARAATDLLAKCRAIATEAAIAFDAGPLRRAGAQEPAAAPVAEPTEADLVALIARVIRGLPASEVSYPWWSNANLSTREHLTLEFILALRIRAAAQRQPFDAEAFATACGIRKKQVALLVREDHEFVNGVWGPMGHDPALASPRMRIFAGSGSGIRQVYAH